MSEIQNVHGHLFSFTLGCCTKCRCNFSVAMSKGCPDGTQEESYVPPMTFSMFQREHAEWAARNFGNARDEVAILRCYVGLNEEVGELGHALLKQAQGIRGTHAEHEAAGKDAVFDTLAYLTDLCTRKGWSLTRIVDDGWKEVKARDWKKNQADGKVVQ